jgi:hypothetical protein
MATKAQPILDHEHTTNGLEPMDEARHRTFLQEGIDELARAEFVEHSVITADIQVMRAEAAAAMKPR